LTNTNVTLQTIANREFQRADRAEKENAALKREIQELRARSTNNNNNNNQAANAVASPIITDPPTPSPFSAPSISVQLVMRFMLLPDIRQASQVSRTWRAASASSVIWEGRPVSIGLRVVGESIRVIPPSRQLQL